MAGYPTVTDERTPRLGGRQFVPPPQWFDLPSLPVTGYEPVLSGEGSRVLADRRGAYLKRNYRALLDGMSEAQVFSMRCWLIRVAARHCTRAVLIVEQHAIDCDRTYSILGMVNAWLTDPLRLSQTGHRLAVFTRGERSWVVDTLPYGLSNAIDTLLRAATSEDDWQALWQASLSYYFARESILRLAGQPYKPWVDWGVRAYQRAQLRAAYTILNAPPGTSYRGADG